MAVKQGERDGDITNPRPLPSSWSHNPLQGPVLMPPQGSWIYEISPSAPTATSRAHLARGEHSVQARLGIERQFIALTLVSMLISH
jgi:hypothetical protein